MLHGDPNLKDGDHVRWVSGICPANTVVGWLRGDEIIVEYDTFASPHLLRGKAFTLPTTGRLDHHPIAKLCHRIAAGGAYDGLTAEQCFVAFQAAQQGAYGFEGRPMPEDGPRPASLTPAQLAVARELWSAKLRAKIAAARASEPRVLVDLDLDGL
jgi:hypothetical protein